MCGIAGVVMNSGEMDPGVLCRVFRRLAHRGPDDSGYLFFSEDGIKLGRQLPCLDPIRGVALLHRRLSILDLGPGGWQPMCTRDKRFYIVFNGEIYNYLELRRELEGLGHIFHSSSDTEVLLASYAQWGKEALLRFVGMFALAILDTRKRSLLLARDFFGIKPLYYTSAPGQFAFASEIKALLELPWVKRRVSPTRLYDYLRYGHTDHGEETLFAEVFQLAPAHWIEIPIDAPNVVQQERYWRLDLTTQAEISFEDAAKKVKDLFFENVLLHLRSDVSVGTALSGGIDSSAIVSTVRAISSRDVELHTFSYIPSDPSLSEERWIDVVTQTTHAVAHKVRPSGDQILEDLDTLIYMQDEPFGSSRIWAQYCVFRLAQQAGVKVMLDGQGADEILGGYRYYMAARLASLVRQKKWNEALRFGKKSSTWPDVGALGLLLRTGGFLLPEAWQGLARRFVGKNLIPSYLNGAWFRERDVEPAPPHTLNSEHAFKELLHRTLTETSLPHLLRYEDRNSMAFSLESRVPFLSPKLAEFLLSLPEEYLLEADGTPKAVFRHAMRGTVPDAILDRRDKIGFATPETEWLTVMRPWVEAVLRSDTARRIQALNLADVQRQMKQVFEGQVFSDFRAWRWINLIRWSERMEVVYE